MPSRKKPWPADSVERMKVAGLTPYANNSRTHSEKQIEQLVESRSYVLRRLFNRID